MFERPVEFLHHHLEFENLMLSNLERLSEIVISIKFQYVLLNCGVIDLKYFAVVINQYKIDSN